MLPRIIQIVRRFGPVGGMETYVWRLVNGLSERGYSVSIICEQVMAEVSLNIEVIQVERCREKPRWKSMLIFRERVEAVLKDRFQSRNIIIHSHERSISHQVTTFHGPPINKEGNLTWFKKLSPRIRGWRQMERHELLSPRVQWVLPVSSKVQDALVTEYPELISKRLKLGWPAVDPVTDYKAQDDPDLNSMRFVFVGKEWKRKGLRRAIDIFESFCTTNPLATLDVYGVDPSAIPKVMRQGSGVRFMGWSKEIPWVQYDVLLHPADTEPFGMVITEARANGLAVLMSDRVGAADLAFNCVRVVSIDSPMSEWVSELNALVALSGRSSEVKWTWDDLLDLHCQTIYPQLEPETL